MSSNGDDPNARNKTVLRPQPGGRGPASGSETIRAAGTSQPAMAPPPIAPPTLTPPVAEFIARGSNPLLAAGGPLLTLGASVAATAYQADVDGLRRQAVEAVKAFEAQALAGGAEASDVTIARYLLCTFVDTAILQTPWGGQSVWGPRALLMAFHNEGQGGVKFFQILERLRTDPARYVNLLELQHACLALGFQGQYRFEPNGRATLVALQEDLYRLVRAHRPAVGAALSPRWQGQSEPRARAMRIVPWWVVGLIGLAVVLVVLVLLRASLSDRAAPLVATLASRGVDSGYRDPAPPRVGRLRQLLEASDQASQFSVEEFGTRTVVTLRVPELFQSGSADVAQGHEALFRVLGKALEAVPGRILVEGHTDDQPQRSWRYPDNLALSRERAQSVAQLIAPELSNRSRLESTGLGDTRPRYLPASSPENRARNRRVEIVHTSE